MTHTLRKLHSLTLYPYGSDVYNTIVALDSTEGTWSVESIVKLPEGTQPQISPEELLQCEDIVKNDPGVQALAKQVGKSRLV